VCGYPELPDPPADYEICPSCGTEFGYSDFTRTHEELRAMWRTNGMQWSATWMPAPPEWNPKRQLATIGVPVVDPNPNAATENTEPSVVRTRNVIFDRLRVAGARGLSHA
jgi:hypothetical protein